jgi:hypothetical protein
MLPEKGRDYRNQLLIVLSLVRRARLKCGERDASISVPTLPRFGFSNKSFSSK